MSCEWSVKLDRYVDSELSGDESKELQEHLAGCAACAAGALSRLQMKRMIQAAAASRYRPSANFRLKIEESVGTPRGRTWVRRWMPALAVAGALLLLVASASVWLRFMRGEQALGELADLHVATLASANPVDVVSTDRHTVKPWFQGKLPFTFNLPELQNSPFRLVGGRVAYFQESPAAQLLFEVRKHQISVFIFQNRAESELLNSGSTQRRNLTFNSETWEEGGLRYFAVGDCSPADLRELGALLKSAAPHV
jgi:anti-sigma factor RsiW